MIKFDGNPFTSYEVVRNNTHSTLKSVVELHKPSNNLICNECKVPWPCDTITLIANKLGLIDDSL